MKFLNRLSKKKKYSNIKFHENQFSGSRFPGGQTDRHDEANRVAFRNFTNVPENADESPLSLCEGPYREDVSVQFTVGAQSCPRH